MCDNTIQLTLRKFKVHFKNDKIFQVKRLNHYNALTKKKNGSEHLSKSTISYIKFVEVHCTFVLVVYAGQVRGGAHTMC